MALLIDRYDRDLLDAAGSQPVSLKVVTGDYVQDFDELPLLIDRKNSAGATQVWNAGEVTMSVPASAGEYAIAQTKISHPYLSGHPNLLTVTFGDFALQTNVTKRILVGHSDTTGNFDTGYDGCMFESDGVANEYKLKLYKNGVLRATLLRSQWDDKLDGTGRSGFNLADFNYFMVMTFDYLYLGGTWMRVGVNVGGQIIYFAKFKNSGYASGTFVGSPRFKIRWEIRSNGGAGSMQQICAGHSIQGNKDALGKEFSPDAGGHTVTAASTANEYLLCAYRLKATGLKAYIIPIDFSVFSNTNNAGFIWRLRMNPTIAGAMAAYTSVPNYQLEFALGSNIGANTITATDAPLFADTGVARSVNNTIGHSIANALGSKTDGTRDVLALTVQPLSSNMPFNFTSIFKQI